jgi:hypothetical protein
MTPHLSSTGSLTSDIDRLIGQPVDIVSSAYEYRADRPAADNAPESWLALMRHE